MSNKIGVVCEGISDYKIIRHIVSRYLRDYDVYTIPLKPKMTLQGKQDGFGTWQGVLGYISGKDQLIVEAVKEGCDFIIIQIDTDVCEEYGVAKNLTNIPLFHQAVIQKLNDTLHSGINRNVIVYAICINEIECWLIPFVSTVQKECSNSNQCINIVNRYIKTTGTIDRDNKNSPQAQILYDKILGQKKKAKDILAASNFNYGFSYFISQLEKIKVHLNSEEI